MNPRGKSARPPQNSSSALQQRHVLAQVVFACPLQERQPHTNRDRDEDRGTASRKLSLAGRLKASILAKTV